MKITPALICDLICILLFALVVLRYMNRGFLADIVSFGGSALSLFGATYASKQYAQPIFDTMLRPGLEKNILQNITENGLDIAALAKKYGGFLPDDFSFNMPRNSSYTAFMAISLNVTGPSILSAFL